MNTSPSVPEMMLIKAECIARGIKGDESADAILKRLRSNRFPSSYTDNIGGTLKDVLDERRRELAFVIRWYDLKRYNALDDTGVPEYSSIPVKKLMYNNVQDLTSGVKIYELKPNDPKYAIPIPERRNINIRMETKLMVKIYLLS